MKRIQNVSAVGLAITFLGGPMMVFAGDQKAESKLKPYPLKTCVVSGEKLGEMGKPYVYEYKDREIKFCCKDCVKDFKKDTAKYIKKIEEAEAKAKK